MTLTMPVVSQPFLFGSAESPWIEVRDANDTARSIFDRHYSRYRYADGRKPKHFVGPGEKMVLLTEDVRAVFVWRKFISGDGQQGVNCAVFRNEGSIRASDLVRHADAMADRRWPGERHYTYVNPKWVRRSRTPGRCFLLAGWKYVMRPHVDTGVPVRATTKHNKLLILEKLPEQKENHHGQTYDAAA